MKRPYKDLMIAISDEMDKKDVGNDKGIRNYIAQVRYYAATYRYQPIYRCEIDGTTYYGTPALDYCYDAIATIKREISRRGY